MALQDAVRHPVTITRERVLEVSGGVARTKVVFLLALVLAIDTADVSTIGSMATNLEGAFHLSSVELGVLASVPAFMTGLATIPVGWLTDRITRVPVLIGGILFWTAGEAASGFSTSFVMLLLLRLAVGAGVAPTGPTLTSLLGDYFPAHERGRIWGLVLSGEIIGAGFGYLISGELASLSWRYAFWVLALAGIWVPWLIWKWLPEPARGGGSQLEEGARRIIAADDPEAQSEPDKEERDRFVKSAAQQKVQQQDVPPHPDLVLQENPWSMGLWQATKYVLTIRTNLVLIIASALGYFYFTGLEVFAIVFIQGRFGVSHAIGVLLIAGVGLAALVGVVLGGWVGDHLLGRGKFNARIWVGGLGFLIAAVAFAPGLLVLPLALAEGLYVFAAVWFTMRNPTLDAARLDIMHHRLWGRAEGVRTFLRRMMIAAAPVSFGALAEAISTRGVHPAGAVGFGHNASTYGLQVAFLVLLSTLAIGGLLTLWALRTYPRDVATAIASEQETMSSAAAAP